MSEDVWSAQDTTPDDIDDALRALLRRRHAANPQLAPARVLNLIVVVAAHRRREISERLAHVGRYHASRTVVCAVERGRESIDARAVMAYDEPPEGPGLIRERVEIDLGPRHLQHLETIVDPVIVSDLPTVLWCPDRHEQAMLELARLVDVYLIDSDDGPEPASAFAAAAQLLERDYVVDLAWLRTTPWRERVAASFDPPARRASLERITELDVRHRESSQASALLLTGWLTSRLQWQPTGFEPPTGEGLGGTARRSGGKVTIALQAADQEAPGLAGVTVASEEGFSLSLDRARGGLCAHQHLPDGREMTWQVLGASRGEGGILGEGVRQALLRDPTYGPALAAARGFCWG